MKLLYLSFIVLILSIMGNMIEAQTYTYNGTGNNQNNPEWGSTGIALRRLFGYSYPDGVSSFLFNRPTCCQLSPGLRAVGELTNSFGLNQAAIILGQMTFSHDLALTSDNPIERIFSEKCISGGISRKQGLPGSGPRNHPNEVTSFLDMSNVYGESESKATALRSFINGKLKVSSSPNGDLLPRGCTRMGVRIDPGPNEPETLFCAGDVRVNENVYLTAYHTLFVREHNRLATLLKNHNSTWTDEQLFYKARVINIAQYQKIIFYELLPLIIGENFFTYNLATYPGYDPNVNPGVFAEMSHGIIRAIRSQVSDSFLRVTDNGKQEAITLADAFFHPQLLSSYPYDEWIRGMNQKPAQPFGPNFAANIIETPGGQLDFKLDVFDCFRSRDIGMADYKTVRASLGLPFNKLTDVTNSSSRIGVLSQYLTHDSIDLFMGAIMEAPTENSQVGPTFQQLMKIQFNNIRNGDRFWFENPSYLELTTQERSYVNSVTIAKIIKRNTDIQCVPSKFFLLPQFSSPLCSV